ncbi:UNVERIFIED_CONTAM: hypothetical protein GTU68_026793 [Idotea baltica]|nr:hypothetical protein [Idotea baltica]
MGFGELRLVGCCPHLTKDALARASGADAVLHEAKRFETLDEAVSDCRSVIGTSARDRYLAVPVMACRDVALEIVADADRSDKPMRTAMVFGRERSGLSNEEMDRCTRLLRIPCNPGFSSLNLGAAVQVVAYECAQASNLVKVESGTDETADKEIAASGEAMQHFYDHLHRIMVATGFHDPDNPRHLMRRIKRYFERNRPTEKELNIFRGILSATEKPFPPKKPEP